MFGFKGGVDVYDSNMNLVFSDNKSDVEKSPSNLSKSIEVSVAISRSSASINAASTPFSISSFCWSVNVCTPNICYTSMLS